MIAPATLAQHWALKSPAQIGMMDVAERFKGAKEKKRPRVSSELWRSAVRPSPGVEGPTHEMKTRRVAPAGLFYLLAIRLVRERSGRPAASLQAQWSWFSGLRD